MTLDIAYARSSLQIYKMLKHVETHDLTYLGFCSKSTNSFNLRIFSGTNIGIASKAYTHLFAHLRSDFMLTFVHCFVPIIAQSVYLNT